MSQCSHGLSALFTTQMIAKLLMSANASPDSLMSCLPNNDLHLLIANQYLRLCTNNVSIELCLSIPPSHCSGRKGPRFEFHHRKFMASKNVCYLLRDKLTLQKIA